MSQDTNYIRIDQVVITDKATQVDYTDYRDQDKTKEEGRYEMPKWVSIPGVAHAAFEKSLKKLIPHFMNECHITDTEVLKLTTIKSIQFKGAHRDKMVAKMEVEGKNMLPFKITTAEIYLHDADKAKSFRTSIEDFLGEVEAHLSNKDTQLQLSFDFTKHTN